jgi:hypothetical protein
MAISLLVENSQVIINIALNTPPISCLLSYLPNESKQELQNGNISLSNTPHIVTNPFFAQNS